MTKSEHIKRLEKKMNENLRRKFDRLIALNSPYLEKYIIEYVRKLGYLVSNFKLVLIPFMLVLLSLSAFALTDSFFVDSSSYTFVDSGKVCNLTVLVNNWTYLYFNGQDSDYVNLTDSGSFSPQSYGNMSISFWFQYSTNPTQQYLFGKGSTNNYEYTCYILGSTRSLECYIYEFGGAPHVTVNSTLLQYNKWYHVVFEYSYMSSANLYINGVLNDTSVGVTANPSSDKFADLLLGVRNREAGKYFNGSLANFKIYNTFLSASDVSSLYNSENVDNHYYAFTRLRNLPFVTNQAGVEYCDGVVYVIRDLNSYSYDISTDSFTDISNPDVAVQSPVLRCVNDRLFLIGGLNSTGNVFYNTTYEYVDSSDTWFQRSSFPIPREDMGSAVVGDFIYIFGGNTAGNVAINSSLKYNTETDIWSSVSDLPVTKWSGDFGESVGSDVYLISSAINLTGYPNMTSITNVSYKYDTLTDTYSAIAQIPLAVAYKEVAYLDGDLYVFGGNHRINTSYVTNVIQVYDVDSDSWSNYTLFFPVAMSGMSLTVVDDEVYIFGGYTGGGAQAYSWKLSNLTNLALDLRLNEYQGSVVYDFSFPYVNGALTGCSWRSDNVNLSLVENVDYTVYPLFSRFNLLDDDLFYSSVYFDYIDCYGADPTIFEVDFSQNFTAIMFFILFAIAGFLFFLRHILFAGSLVGVLGIVLLWSGFNAVLSLIVISLGILIIFGGNSR